MKPIICSAWSFRGATEGGEPGIHSPRPVVMDSGLAASDLGFTRDRHYTMRTSATADVRWRPGMTRIDSNFETAQPVDLLRRRANCSAPTTPFKDTALLAQI